MLINNVVEQSLKEFTRGGLGIPVGADGVSTEF